MPASHAHHYRLDERNRGSCIVRLPSGRRCGKRYVSKAPEPNFNRSSLDKLGRRARRIV